MLNDNVNDIEDIGIVNHKDRGYKESSIFNGLLESVAGEFKNAMDGFATVGDIDRFKKVFKKSINIRYQMRSL